MALNVQIASTPAYSDFPFHNYGVTDIPAGVYVTVDAANTVGAGQQGVGIKLPTTAGTPVVGTTLDIIRAGTSGRVRCPAPLSTVTAELAITAGTYVMPSGTVGHLGEVRPATTGLLASGLALTTGTAGDQVLVLLVFQTVALAPPPPGLSRLARALPGKGLFNHDCTEQRQ